MMVIFESKSLQAIDNQRQRPLKNAPIARPEERGRQERTLVRDLARTTRTPLEAILRRSFAFTLLEMTVVLGIILLLIATVLPMGYQMLSMSKGRRFVHDCELFIQAAEKYRLDTGSYPAPIDAGGSLPSDLQRYFHRGFSFSEKTPIGGQWVWLNLAGVDGFTQGYAIEALASEDFLLTVDESTLTKLNAEFDNGSATSGRHRHSGIDYYRVCTADAR